MKYALLKYRDQETNIGDYIQSLAAKRFLPQVDALISREALDETKENAKIILNGWFMHHPEHWPPSETLLPKFVSFHINDFAKKPLTSPEAIAYYKKHQPIGCRDKFTLQKLKENGVEAYFSGCLTLTLEKEKYQNTTTPNAIVLCDILSHKNDVSDTNKKSLWKTIRNPHKPIINATKSFLKEYKEKKEAKKIIEKLIPKSILEQSITVSNQDFNATTHEEKFKKAEQLLSLYASAKLVVTSRIHVALPCLAFGTPVIFVRPDRDTSRFEGITDFFNTFTIDQILNTEKTELQQQFTNSSKIVRTEHLKYREQLIKDVSQFINS
ncbi:polysaccharide pyruvyl transferase family protein [Mesoflavibacter zeaxanthinifaciens]|uniref:polysaccharide pyruvyl transferase family protein n=1 Tax=Mesoflavibacter zeaxanthinifaciens TaxID=393060 RepID=UPI003A93C964